VVIVDGRQEDWRPELALVYEVVGELVIGVDPDLEPGQDDLTAPTSK
jgi:hypothetical protein